MSTSVTFAPFDIIHSDLWTSPVLSVNGFRYYLVLLDDFTHFAWVYPLRYKSEVYQKFIEFNIFVKTQFQKNIKSFQTDMGREFNNQLFHNFCLRHGMQFRFSCPHTSSQNGKAERIIRTLNNITRSLLTQASMPPSRWVEAVLMATYLHNILPSKTLSLGTPTQALFLRNPTYDHLKVFGCLCYPNLSSTMKLKLSPRSAPCVFIGFPSNHRGYLCLDIMSKKVIISRHVTFDEQVFPFSDLRSFQPESYDFLSSNTISPLVIDHFMSHERNQSINQPSPNINAPPPTPPRQASVPVSPVRSSAPSLHQNILVYTRRPRPTPPPPPPTGHSMTTPPPTHT